MANTKGEGITASIVLFENDCEMVAQVIKCVLDTGLISELSVIDNSPDDSLKKVCSQTNCRYTHVAKNIGFGAAHNIAIRSSSGEFHVVINPDIFFEKDALLSMARFMQENSDIGLLSPKVCFPDGKVQYLCRRYPSVYMLFVRRFMPSILRKHFKSSFDYSEMRETGYDHIMDIEFATGCFMFLRRNVLDLVDGFDERFFLYFEDMDLSFRVSKISRVVFNPNTVVFHHWQRGSYKSIKLTLCNIVSAFKFFNKHGWRIF